MNDYFFQGFYLYGFYSGRSGSTEIASLTDVRITAEPGDTLYLSPGRGRFTDSAFTTIFALETQRLQADGPVDWTGRPGQSLMNEGNLELHRIVGPEGQIFSALTSTYPGGEYWGTSTFVLPLSGQPMVDYLLEQVDGMSTSAAYVALINLLRSNVAEANEADVVLRTPVLISDLPAIRVEESPAREPVSRDDIRQVIGSDGDDTLNGSDVAEAIRGEIGNDSLNGNGGDDTVYGGPGNDTLSGLDGDDLLYAGGGRNLLGGGTGNDSVNGGDAQDTLYGGEGDDVIRGGNHIQGHETGSADAGDLIFAGPGNDHVIGDNTFDSPEPQNGADTIDAGAGDDTVFGQYGNDLIAGGIGSDTLIGGAGNDTIYGFSDPENANMPEVDLADFIFGGQGDDFALGGYGNDRMSGGGGNDTLEGQQGADTIAGQEGDDLLTGGALGDELHGNDGADFLNGGFGFDRLNGGAGADRFFHQGVAGHGSDWIQDYNAADGDVLLTRDDLNPGDFQVNYALTPGAGAADVAEAFIIYRPTGQIIWALVDGQAQDDILLRIDMANTDLA